MAYVVTFNRGGTPYRQQTVDPKTLWDDSPDSAAFHALPWDWQDGDVARVEEGPGYIEFEIEDIDDEYCPRFNEVKE